MSNQKSGEPALTAVEKIKMKSDGLRGSLADSLKDELTGALREDDQSLIKHHGMYQQDDRDLRDERAHKKLEWLYSFMIRLRLPGGFLSPAQWIALHHIAGEHSTGVIKVTTRQTIQLHGILKSHLKPTLKAFAVQRLDSIAACGDVNRNVICSAHPKQSRVHEEVFQYADKISTLALPKTNAYYEIWLDRESLTSKEEEKDPLYQDRYLPRKFKIAIAIPPNNDVDVYANDIGLIAVIENDKLLGFNMAIGGGLGATHGNKDTYPRLATVIGFLDTEEKILKAVYEVMTVQRDYGNRSDRKQARLKYTIDKMGIEQFKSLVEERSGFKFEPALNFQFDERTDYFGWHQNHEGKWYYTVFVENGRIADEKRAIKTALYEIAQTGKANFRFTANQKVILSDIESKDKEAVHQILLDYDLIEHTQEASPMRLNAIACVAMNTCPLALAEGQRYLPGLISKIEPLLKKYKLLQDPISIRMTGCPNGCGRPYLAEIGLVGTSYGHYNLHLGGDRLGLRLNEKKYENVDEEAILDILEPLFKKYAGAKKKYSSFGDFIHLNPGLTPS
jgi:sulfite reductase (NADPH) hemoprotein beta-component